MAALAKTFKFAAAAAALAAMVVGEKQSKKDKSCKTKLSVQKQKEVRSLQDRTSQLTQQAPEVSDRGFGLIVESKEPKIQRMRQSAIRNKENWVDHIPVLM